MDEKTKVAISGVLLQVQDLLQALNESLNEAMLRLERISKEAEAIAGKKEKGPEYTT